MKNRKDNAKYWAERVFFYKQASGPEPDYSVKIQHAGRRERFRLWTSDKENAGDLALEIYRTLKAHGWDRAIAQFKKGKAPTSAELALNLYIRALRKIVSDIEKLNPDNLSRYGTV